MHDISPESPEARRKRLAIARAHLGTIRDKVRSGWRPFEVVKRVVVGVYSDGFIHAGNLAYLALLSIFPFVIVAAAVARLFGQSEEGLNAVNALLVTMPDNVAAVLERPIHDVLEARTGNLLWFGALIGLWTTGSFIETIRDIIRRAYGVSYSRPFWEYRLGSLGMIFVAVIVAMIALSLSVAASSIQGFLIDLIPGADWLVGLLTLFQVVPALALFGSIYALFYVLTPKRYRDGCPKWPGAAFVAAWWVATAYVLPLALSRVGSYDLTYGSLAGVMIAMIFFFIVGLGLVIGAELNAALAEPGEAAQEADDDTAEAENGEAQTGK